MSSIAERANARWYVSVTALALLAGCSAATLGGSGSASSSGSGATSGSSSGGSSSGGCGVVPGAGSGSSGASLATIADDAAFIRSSSLPDGAICESSDCLDVVPYFGNFAGWGLARAAQVTGDSNDLLALENWLTWYAAHMNAGGYVTDYQVLPDGGEASTGDFDSTDGYAGTFLLALNAAALDDPSVAASLSAAIPKALGAIESTQQSDGLTWAKPNYRVKYLMDAAEAYAGARAAEDLALRLGDSALLARATSDADALQAGIGSLWDADAGAYDFMMDEAGTRSAPDWSVLYPDATSELWPIALGNWALPCQPPLVDPARASALVAAFLANQPNWGQPAAAADIAGSTQPAGYWPMVALALDAVGRRSDALAGDASIRVQAADGGLRYPFTPGYAGEIIQGESMGR